MKTWYTTLCKRLVLATYLLAGVPPVLFSQHYTVDLEKIWTREAAAFHLPRAPLPFYQDYDQTFCLLDIRLERNTVYVSGNVTTTAVSKKAPLFSYCFELVPDLLIDSVKVNGQPATYTRDGDTGCVALDPPVPLGSSFSVCIYYGGLPATGGFFSGINSQVSTQWGNEVTWTLSEPFNARQWWPCKQDLTDKFDSAWIFITTDSANMAGSNGLLTAITPVAGGKSRYEWKTRYPIVYYLLSAAVADYQEYTVYAHPPAPADSIMIQHFIYDAPGCLAHYQSDLDNTCTYLELFVSLFGPYPFAAEKYGHCQAHLGGGMEHQTMSTMGAFDFGLNTHELAHQWFGDHVTCASWSDIWINEGFATYAQYLALQYLAGQPSADQFMRGVQQYSMSAPGGSVYIPPEQAHDVGRIFDGRLSYNKGAAILHALRGVINNDSLFFLVLQQYLAVFGNGIASGNDFKNTASQVSGIDFGPFFDQWYFGEGYPILDIRWWQTADTVVIALTQNPSSPVTPLFTLPFEFLFRSAQSDTLVRVLIDQAAQTFKLKAGFTLDSLLPDPRLWNLYKLNSLQHVREQEMPAGLLVYPNPCIDYLKYQLLGDPGDYTLGLYDISGRRILQLDELHPHGLLDMSPYARGIYYLVLQGEKTRQVRKIAR